MPGLSTRFLRIFVLLLCVCLAGDRVSFAFEPSDTATLKQQIASHGVGAVVRLSRKNGSEIKGKIVSIGDDACTLQVKKEPAPVNVLYADVNKVRGSGLSHGAKVGIIVGACVLAAVGIAAIVVTHKITTGFPKAIPI